MKTFKGKIQDFKPNLAKESVVVVGYFDGLHRYHQELLNKAMKVAKENNLNLIVVTFSKKINSATNGFDLMGEETKKNYLKQHYQIDEYLILEVDNYLTSLSPQNFIVWLKENLRGIKIVEGADFRFGHLAKGNISTLQKAFGEENVIVLPRKNTVSSTLIREQLMTGEIDAALQNLGHDLIIEIEKDQNFKQFIWLAPQINLPPNKYEIETAEGEKIILNYQSRTIFKFQPENLVSKTLYLKKMKLNK